MSEAHLAVQFKHRIGLMQFELEFVTTAPWTVLFGVSGSGKSTILRSIAGLLRPDAGTIEWRGRVLTDTAARVFVPAHQRGVRWVGQTATLFPRMTVREILQLAQPERSADRVQAAVEHFGLKGLIKKQAGTLSGGERQRVAVVAAALGEGQLLLLDEPFSGMDERLRDDLIARLRKWMGGTPVLSVTHDVGEAFLLGAEIVRIADGKVAAQGLVEVVLAEERDRLKAVLGG